MKKYLYLLFVALFATMSFALTSCGDDDDEPNDPTTGKMELTIDGQKYAFGNPMANVDGDQYYCLVSNNDCSLGFLILNWDEVSTGTLLTDENFELNWTTDEAIMAVPSSNTSVKVKEKTNKSITITFNNAKFDARYESFTVNGTITLPIK